MILDDRPVIDQLLDPRPHNMLHEVAEELLDHIADNCETLLDLVPMEERGKAFDVIHKSGLHRLYEQPNQPPLVPLVKVAHVSIVESLPYDSKTPAEVVHDYAVVRGDLSEQYARDQLALWIERYAAETARRHLREEAALIGDDTCCSECNAVADLMRDRAGSIR